MTFKQTFLANFLGFLAAIGVATAVSKASKLALGAIKANQQSNQSTTEPYHLNP